MPVFIYFRNMKKTSVLFAIVLIMTSACSGSRDDQFCKCLKASEGLNALSSELMAGDIDQAKADKLKELKRIKKEACVNYTSMSGKDMLECKAECK